MRLISTNSHTKTEVKQREGRRRASTEQVEKLIEEINLRWTSLIRSNLSILDLLQDPKIPNGTSKPKLYVHTSGNDTVESIRNQLIQLNPAGEIDQINILKLPSDINSFPNLEDHGTLYLPFPYVVPGGRFQEMYAWDSFFIAIGLLRDNQTRLARNMVDNYIYQIEHYGTILNGNRTYYLTRSQLPLLTPLIKLILPTVRTEVRQVWLRRAIDAAEKYHKYWTTGPHLTPSTGLSRFFDFGTPGSSPPEIIHESDPKDGSSAHSRVKHFFRDHYLTGIPDYDISEYYDFHTDTLTPKFMDNDRAMRESGFDTSSRFGPFNSKILDFNPICLNSLIYLMEKDLSELYTLIDPSTARPPGSKIIHHNNKSKFWLNKSLKRRELIHTYNWDSKSGVYLDYDYIEKTRKEYIFGTTFIPLWAGLSTLEHATEVCKNGVGQLEIGGGISTSTKEAGDQWDKPYVWAPLQFFAVDGLRRYGFDLIADRIAANFNSMVLKTWLNTGHLWEKYNGVKRDQSVVLKFGYPTNEAGFGWTNAVFTHFYDQLKSAGKVDDSLLLDGIPVPVGAGTEQISGMKPPTTGTLDNSISELVLKDLGIEDLEWVEIGVDHPPL
ncbi:hypothetical protein PSTT_11792 [Puccinia striiformis]|uniref:Trehalase n=1 Tax=Puccinia striiformis TaxID=27350 RepID=A0A2S4UYU8_9BASI|nr:hypothetical protein PSTT_11792 [Puccinia striiformis]